MTVELDGLVGHRVALRHRVGERDGRPLYSDAVGELALDGDGVLVATRRGPVRVLRGAVAAVRAVPPAMPRRASLTAVARLEELCADAWPAQVDEPLGRWRLRAAGGYTGRANSALAVGAPGVPVPVALDAVRAFSARHGISPRVQVPDGSPWDRAVTAQGWTLDVAHTAGAEVDVLVAELGALTGPTPTPPSASTSVAVEVGTRASAEWWAVVGEGPAARRAVLEPGGDLRVAFLLARAADGDGDGAGGAAAGGDGAAGALRAAVVQDHLHLSVLEVLPPARRRGSATALVAAAAGWGRARGARWAVLQVARQNTGARALYDRLGFVEHHRYRYLVPPPP